jgi:hypothetical protein
MIARTRPRGFAEHVGTLVGMVVAPFFGIASWLRRGRAFHPEGTCFWATVTPVAVDPRLTRVAEHLGRRALVRLSPALWRGVHEHFEVLGCAVRFTDREDETAGPLDQDLLCATIWRPATLLLSSFFTNASDYLANVYDAAAPFDVQGIGRCLIRLVPARGPSPDAPDREARLERAFAQHEAAFRLEVRRADERAWEPLAQIDLRQHARLDQEALRFDPWNAGRGLRPRGFVHAIRRAAYRMSQKLRPARGRRLPVRAPSKTGDRAAA